MAVGQGFGEHSATDVGELEHGRACIDDVGAPILSDQIDGGRVESTTGMCTHKADITDRGEIDDEVEAWIKAAYLRAHKPT